MLARRGFFSARLSRNVCRVAVDGDRKTRLSLMLKGLVSLPRFSLHGVPCPEVFGGILMALGLLTRPFAFFNGILAFVAFFIFYSGNVSGGALRGTASCYSNTGLPLTGPGRTGMDCLIGLFGIQRRRLPNQAIHASRRSAASVSHWVVAATA